jgi:hypothetical protein
VYAGNIRPRATHQHSAIATIHSVTLTHAFRHTHPCNTRPCATRPHTPDSCVGSTVPETTAGLTGAVLFPLWQPTL